MVTDAFSRARGPRRLPRPPRHGHSSGPIRRGTRWRAMLGLTLIAAVAVVAVLMAGPSSSPRVGPRLTHTVSRGTLRVTVTEQGLLESAENKEIKCQVGGMNTVIWVIENGTQVQPGDELVRLDSLLIEEQIDERTKYAYWSRAGAEYSEAQVAKAELTVQEYEQGTYVQELMTLQKDLAIAESRLRSAQNMLDHARLMAQSHYVSPLEVDEKEFALAQATLAVELKKTEIDVLERFTTGEQLQTLRGNLAASEAEHEANVERATADASRRDRALQELQYCVVTAEKAGLVIHPSSARWENAPEISEGSTVYKDQVLLLMPDLAQMQVKVGVHESVISDLRVGLSATVTLPNSTLEGTVSEVASVTRPTGWWTGNEVRYDTIIQLPPVDGLKPGMSAEVEILVARHEDVLSIPVAAVVESPEGNYCWVQTREGPERHPLTLGDGNGIFTVVQAGLQEGDEVLLHPQAFEGSQMAAAPTAPELKP